MIDEYSRNILRELIRNPRQSDNQLARKLGMAVKTVNNKRKRLEKQGIVSYMASVNNGPNGTGSFGATAMYTITFKHGVYRKQFIDALASMPYSDKDPKHIAFMFLGEKDGHLVLMLLMRSRTFEDILEIFNVEIIRKINTYLGNDLIESTFVTPIADILTCFHNYSSLLNMESGTIKDTWPSDLIYVSD